MADVFAQQQALARRKALLSAMQEQNMSSPIVGNTGLGQALAKIATAYVLKNGGKNLDAETASNRDQYNSELGGALEGYMRRKEGAPAHELPPELAGPVTTGEDADPRGAILSAMASKFPEMQQIGRAEFGQLGKKPEYKEHLTQDGTIVRTYDNGDVKPLGNFAKPKDKYGPVEDIKGASGQLIKVQRNLTTGQLEPIDKGVNVTTNVGAGDKEALKETAGVLKGAREAQIAGRDSMRQAEQIDALAKDPAVITGFAAGPLQGIANLAAKVGITGPEAPAKTQALMSSLAKQTLNAQQYLKGPTSDRDIEFLREASSGNMNYTPEAIQYLAGVMKAAAHNQMIESRRQWESAATVNGAGEIVKLHPQPNFGSWKINPEEFSETEDGLVYYKGGSQTTPRAATPSGPAPTSAPGQPAATPTFRGKPLDARIKWEQ